MGRKVIIGSRGSKLALWQAHFTKTQLEKSGFTVEIKIIKTKGDRIQHLSFDKIEGKGFFTKEIEDALLEKTVDLAVHSCKDMPSENTPGLNIVGFSKSANPCDVLVVHPSAHDSKKLWGLKENAVIGTSSSRRKSQVLSYRPDAICKDIRGNVPTRLSKLDEGNFDAIVLAAAGIERLQIDLGKYFVHTFNPLDFIPAPAQGVLAFQIREEDEQLHKIVAEHLNDERTARVVSKERSIMAAIGGGCHTPLGIYINRTDEISTVHVAYGIENQKFSKRLLFYINNEDEPTFLASIKESKPNPKRIFIGTDVKDDDYFFRAMKAAGHEVISESLIDFEGVAFEADFTGVDWLFFASKNGVRYFFEKVSPKEIQGIKIGAVSSGTALVLKEHGVRVDFIGQSAKMVDVATEFKKSHKGFVVFVRAERSQRSMQQVFTGDEYRDLVVYTNVAKDDVKRTDADVYVFTSSLGVRSYLKKHPIDKDKHIIAIGSATGDTVRTFGYNCAEAFQPSMAALAEEVFSMNFRNKNSKPL